jgi:hypothetical protein
VRKRDATPTDVSTERKSPPLNHETIIEVAISATAAFGITGIEENTPGKMRAPRAAYYESRLWIRFVIHRYYICKG